MKRMKQVLALLLSLALLLGMASVAEEAAVPVAAEAVEELVEEVPAESAKEPVEEIEAEPEEEPETEAPADEPVEENLMQDVDEPTDVEPVEETGEFEDDSVMMSEYAASQTTAKVYRVDVLNFMPRAGHVVEFCVVTSEDTSTLRLYDDRGQLIKTWDDGLVLTSVSGGRRYWNVQSDKSTFKEDGSHVFSIVPYRIGTAGETFRFEMYLYEDLPWVWNISVLNPPVVMGRKAIIHAVTDYDAKYLRLYASYGEVLATWSGTEYGNYDSLTQTCDWVVEYTFDTMGKLAFNLAASRNSNDYDFGMRETFSLTIEGIKATDVILSQDSCTLSIYPSGNQTQLLATIMPADASDKGVIWSSDDETIATVEDGLVTAVGIGTTTIHCVAADGNGASASCLVTVTDKLLDRLRLNRSELTLFQEDSATLVATYESSGIETQDVAWTSSQESVATVQDGVVSAISPGESTITCTSLYDESVSASCKVYVVEDIPVTGIQLDPEEVILRPGQSQVVQTRYLPGNATNYRHVDVYCTDEEEAVFYVEEEWEGKKETIINQKITATGLGLAEIYYYLYDEETDHETLIGTRRIRVTNVFDKLPLAMTLRKGSSQKLKASSTKSKGFSYASSDTRVATVDRNGKLKAKNFGTAIISVTDNASGERAYFELTVPPMPVSIAITGQPESGTLNLGGELQLSATVLPFDALQEVTWKSSKPKIASVDKNTGLVKALKEGKATITAMAKQKNSKGKSVAVKYTLTVVDPTRPIAIKIDPETPKELVMTEGPQVPLQLKYTLEPAGIAESEVTWSIPKKAHKSYASVTKEGMLTAKKAGKVQVKVTAKKKNAAGKTLSATIEITITDPTIPTSVTITEADGTQINKGEKLTLHATCAPETAANAELEWSSSNTKIAKVNKTTGEITAVKPGKAKITAKAKKGGQKASITIQVIK